MKPPATYGNARTSCVVSNVTLNKRVLTAFVNLDTAGSHVSYRTVGNGNVIGIVDDDLARKFTGVGFVNLGLAETKVVVLGIRPVPVLKGDAVQCKVLYSTHRSTIDFY